MSTEFIRSTVFDFFKIGFVSTEVEYENHETIDPSVRSTPYVALALRFTSNEQISFNPTPRTRQRGAVQTDIYVKQGKGSKEAYIIANAIETLFARKSVSNIEFGTPTTLTPVMVNGWFRLTIRSPFFFDS